MNCLIQQSSFFLKLFFHRLIGPPGPKGKFIPNFGNDTSKLLYVSIVQITDLK